MGQLYDNGMLIPLPERDAELKVLWAEFKDVPIDTFTGEETIMDSFLHFPCGTAVKEIWMWFDLRYSKGVGHLIASDGTECTIEVGEMYYRKQLCEPCDAECCAFNPDGICMYPLVYGKEPGQNFNGCNGFCYKAKEEDDG